MLFADSAAAVQWIVLGSVVVCALLFMRHLNARSRRELARLSTAIDDPEDVPESRTAGAVVNLLEVRLYNFVSEAEARMGTRIEQLDRLILEADREILRLDELLQKTAVPRAGRSVPSASQAVAPAKQQMVVHLHDAGYSVPEIATMLGQTEDAVAAALRAA
jgi:DNA-directed RNA polymerase specialized sigma24 family protein